MQPLELFAYSDYLYKLIIQNLSAEDTALFEALNVRPNLASSDGVGLDLLPWNNDTKDLPAISTLLRARAGIKGTLFPRLFDNRWHDLGLHYLASVVTFLNDLIAENEQPTKTLNTMLLKDLEFVGKQTTTYCQDPIVQLVLSDLSFSEAQLLVSVSI